MTLPARLAASVVLLCIGAASAQTTVYRCGPDGRQYSQQPCPGGSQFDAADPRDPTQRAQARQLADQERTRAARLERERLASEAARPPSRAVGLDARHAAPPAPAASQSKRSPRRKSVATAGRTADADFTARDPAPPRVRRAP